MEKIPEFIDIVFAVDDLSTDNTIKIIKKRAKIDPRINLIIHEALHLHLYSKLKENIYLKKFKFDKEKYIGSEKIIQLDEGFAGFFTEKILENFEMNTINELPIYSGLNEAPEYNLNMTVPVL